MQKKYISYPGLFYPFNKYYKIHGQWIEKYIDKIDDTDRQHLNTVLKYFLVSKSDYQKIQCKEHYHPQPYSRSIWKNTRRHLFATLENGQHVFQKGIYEMQHVSQCPRKYRGRPCTYGSTHNWGFDDSW